jgi:glutathione S-transferase
MIIVHHLENSRSQRILWLLEELGADYEIKHYKRNPETSLAPPELLEVHALGKSPVITDDTTTVAESGAIVEYLVARFDDGRLLPAAGTAERLAYTYWLHYAEGTFMPLMVISLILGRIETAKMPFFAKPIAKGISAKVRGNYLAPNVKRNLDFMESTLAKSHWFCGEVFTAADIQMSFPLEAAAVRTSLQSDYPNLALCLERMHARPAYKAALANGGPYRLMGGD